MPHSYVSNRVHYAFSTKRRARLIAEKHQARLWAFMGGVAKKNGMTPIAIGGVEDHCHALVALPADKSVMKAVQLLKAGTSKFMNQSICKTRFQWQKGYFGASVSVSMTPATVRYIANQKNHHTKMSYEEELRILLKKHGIDLDPDEFLD